MKQRQRSKYEGLVIGGWTVSDFLGRGGNGEVLRASRGDQVGAIKFQKGSEASQQRLDRLRDEVEALRRCGDIPGVLPLLDANLAPAGGTNPWFVMGLATSMEDTLGQSSSLGSVVEAVAAIARTLEAVHARGLSHRDIKPDNLFWFEKRWCVGDFGLATFEGKAAKTERGERIGPLFFIAPEMMNDALTSDGRAADVFSLAKTLWVLATGQRYPMPGAYDISFLPARLSTYVQADRTTLLDRLIVSATALDPVSRPTMADVAQELHAWLSPQPLVSTMVKLDTARFAAELERRRAEVDAAASAQVRRDGLNRETATRILDAFGPLAHELANALTGESFLVRSDGAINGGNGLEVVADIPLGLNSRGTIAFRLNVRPDASGPFNVEVFAVIYLTLLGPIRFGTSLWHKKSFFLAGGAVENERIEQLKRDVTDEFPRAMESALGILLGNSDEETTKGARLRVVDEKGSPISGTEVIAIGAKGDTYRSSTSQDGSAVLEPMAGAAGIRNVIFIAHKDYCPKVAFLPVSEPVVLAKSPAIGSLIATRGWASVDGLSGQIDLIHDSHDRRYMYGSEGVVFNDGETEPVHLELDKPVTVRGTDSSSVLLTPRAFSGPCFLLEVARLPPNSPVG